MKYVFTVFLCFLSIQQMNAQSLSMFGIDASKFPEMKAKFYAFDAAGKQRMLNKNDLRLSENGLPRIITNVTCPIPSPPKPVSTVLVLDVSGSMKQKSGPVRNIDLAKAAAHIWVRSLVVNGGECAITSFDSKNYLNQDFTTDTNQLNDAIDYLVPQGGTNYDAALLNPMAGGLVISKNGIHKRIIILLTDGAGQGNQNAIIAEANNQNCAIYCVTLGMPAPANLIEIAGRTGGMVFENVRTPAEVENVYLKILEFAQGDGPCEITWNSAPQCTSNLTYVNLHWNALISNGSYSPPTNSISYIQVNPNYVYIKNVDMLSQTDKIISLKAINDSMLILDVTPTNNSPKFTIIDGTFPRMLAQNSEIKLTLRFIPTDSFVQYVSYLVRTPQCTYSFSATGHISILPIINDSVYIPKKKNFPQTLQLTHPNGNETFVIGSDSVITWTGIAPSDTVSLDYSTDSGKVWKSVTPKTTGLLYKWQSIPAPTSNKCLVRVSQLQEIDSIELYPSSIYKHPKSVNDVAFSAIRTFVASAGDTMAIIWETDSGTIYHTLLGHTDVVSSIAFSQDGTTLVTGSFDNTAKVWDIVSGMEIRTLKGHNGAIYNVAYSFNSNIIATASADMTAKIWNLKTGANLFTLQGHTDIVYGIAISKDGNRIATSSADKTIKIWDAFTGNLLQTLSGHKGYIYAVSFSPDGSMVGSVSNDNTAKIWDLNSGTIVQTLNHGGLVSDIAFSPDGKQVITASRDYHTKVWDVATGAVVRLLSGGSSNVKSVAFSPDGKRIITANNSREVAIWDEQGPLQEDVSDSVFSIVAPQPAAADVAMGTCSVGKSKDSVVTPVIWNNGSYPYTVKSIAITGPDAAQFSMISGLPPVQIGVIDTHAVEFRFSPTSPGNKSAQLVIYTQSDTLRRRITGVGVTPAITILGNVIDFGKVLINTNKDTLQTLTIRNTSSMPITITSTRHAGPNTKDYSTIAGGGTFQLKPGDTAKLDLRFSPKTTGRTSGRILFEYDGFDSPETVQLYGEGVKPGARILASSLLIPPLICNTEKTDTIVIRNRGTDTLRIDQATLSGANYMDFQFVTPFQPVKVFPDSVFEMLVKFTPLTVGPKTALLEIHSNSIVDSFLKITLTGRKETVAFSSSMSVLDFGTLCPNETRDSVILLTNTGTVRSTLTYQSPSIGSTTITLDTSETKSINLKYRSPANEGIFSEIITITDTMCGVQTTVQVIGNSRIPKMTYPAVIDFGAVQNGGTSTQEIIAVNTDSRPIVIASPQGITSPFTLVSLTPAVGTSLSPGDTLKAFVQYIAGSSIPSQQFVRWNIVSPCMSIDSTELRVNGIPNLLTSTQTIAFDSVCIGQPKIMQAMISNKGGSSMQLMGYEWITNSGSTFTTNLPPQLLAPDSSVLIPIEFTPTIAGFSTAEVRWIADKDTAFTTISGVAINCTNVSDTARTTVSITNIIAQAGERVKVQLMLKQNEGMQFVGAPTDWKARILYNKSILFNEKTSNVCEGTTDSCVMELSGVYDPSNKELASIPCIATLGNTDFSSLIIDDFTWTNSSIATDVVKVNGTITLNGICEDGGVRLFIPANNSTSLASRPNPAQDQLQIQYGLREPLTVTLELLTITGQVVQTIATNQSQVSGQYTLTSNISTLGNGVYLLRLRTNKEMLTTRVDVVK